MWPHRRQPTRLSRPWDSPGKNTGVGCHFLLQCMKVKSESEVAQSCPTLSDPMDCSLPDSSFHGIFQARVLEWGAIASSRVRVWRTNSKLAIQRCELLRTFLQQTTTLSHSSYLNVLKKLLDFPTDTTWSGLNISKALNNSCIFIFPLHVWLEFNYT